MIFLLQRPHHFFWVPYLAPPPFAFCNVSLGDLTLQSIYVAPKSLYQTLTSYRIQEYRKLINSTNHLKHTKAKMVLFYFPTSFCSAQCSLLSQQDLQKPSCSKGRTSLFSLGSLFSLFLHSVHQLRWWQECSDLSISAALQGNTARLKSEGRAGFKGALRMWGTLILTLGTNARSIKGCIF